MDEQPKRGTIALVVRTRATDPQKQNRQRRIKSSVKHCWDESGSRQGIKRVECQGRNPLFGETGIMSKDVCRFSKKNQKILKQIVAEVKDIHCELEELCNWLSCIEDSAITLQNEVHDECERQQCISAWFDNWSSRLVLLTTALEDKEVSEPSAESNVSERSSKISRQQSDSGRHGARAMDRGIQLARHKCTYQEMAEQTSGQLEFRGSVPLGLVPYRWHEVQERARTTPRGLMPNCASAVPRVGSTTTNTSMDLTR